MVRRLNGRLPWLVACAAVLSLTLVSPAFAQSTGMVRGVVKDAAGTVRSVELTEVPALTSVAAEYGLADAPSCLVDDEDVREVGEVLHAGSHAVALLVEHVWARETAEAAWSAGGSLMASVRIPDAYVAEATANQVLTA